jgi:hypothetical protein
MKLFCLYNIKPEVSAEAWERFLREEDIPFTLDFQSIRSYQIFKNGGNPEGPMCFQYIEEIEVSDMEAFRADTQTERWTQGMDAWYAAGGASWCFFYPENVAST